MLIIFLIIIFGMIAVEKLLDISVKHRKKTMKRESYSKSSLQKKWRYYGRVQVSK